MFSLEFLDSHHTLTFTLCANAYYNYNLGNKIRIFFSCFRWKLVLKKDDELFEGKFLRRGKLLA